MPYCRILVDTVPNKSVIYYFTFYQANIPIHLYIWKRDTPPKILIYIPTHYKVKCFVGFNILQLVNVTLAKDVLPFVLSSLCIVLCICSVYVESK